MEYKILDDTKTTLYIGLITAAIILFCYLKFTQRQKCTSKMPSPKGYHFIGPVLDLAKMAKRPHILMEKWAEELGEIYSISIFGKKIVFLNTVDVIYEALMKKGKDFSGREPSLRLSYMFGDMQGRVADIVLHNPDAHWAKRRKVAHRSLKMFGEGMIRLCDLSLKYVDILVDKFAQHGEEAFDPGDAVSRVFTGMMYSLALGVYIEDQSQDMEDALQLQLLVEETLSTSADGLLLDEIPFLRYFGNPVFKSACKFRETRDALFDRLLRDIKEKVASTKYSDRAADEDDSNTTKQVTEQGVAEALFMAQKYDTTNTFTDISIYGVLTNLVAGGVGTSAASFYTMLNVLVAQPEIQERVYEEIHHVLGEERYPKISDREDMPYSNAVVLETIRISSVMPVLLPHCTTVDAEIAGYKVSKNTLVIMNAWAAQHDAKYWNDPYSFLPERFLGEDGKLVPHDHPYRKGILSFGAGAKSCIGEVLAKNRLFLFLVTSLQHFQLEADPESESAKNFNIREYEMETVLKPRPFKLRAIVRKQQH